MGMARMLNINDLRKIKSLKEKHILEKKRLSELTDRVDGNAKAKIDKLNRFFEEKMNKYDNDMSNQNQMLDKRLHELEEKMFDEQRKIDRLKVEANNLINKYGVKYPPPPEQPKTHDRDEPTQIDRLRSQMEYFSRQLKEERNRPENPQNSFTNIGGLTHNSGNHNIAIGGKSFDGEFFDYGVNFENKMTEEDRVLREKLHEIYLETGFRFRVPAGELGKRIIQGECKPTSLESPAFDLAVGGVATKTIERPKWKWAKEFFNIYDEIDNSDPFFIRLIWDILPKETLITEFELKEASLIKKKEENEQN